MPQSGAAGSDIDRSAPLLSDLESGGRERAELQGASVPTEERGPPSPAPLASDQEERHFSSALLAADAAAFVRERELELAAQGDQEMEEASEGDEDQDEDEDEEFEDEDAVEVWELRCAATEGCHVSLSLRGMAVRLVAEISTVLFSSDIPSEAVGLGAVRVIETCSCQARHVICGGCRAAVGYHVVKPCELCALAGHNGHFWLFPSSSVTGSKRGLLWSELPYNGRTQPEVDGADAEPAAAAPEACLICAAAPMWRPTRLGDCGHVFCFGCISREVDARGRCPLDRRPATRESLQPITEVSQ